MCGIAGIIGKKETDKLVIKKMTDAIQHRGMDGEGFYSCENFVFGHRRLAIIDLSSAAAQPMQYLNRYVITYNGEIYNYIEIKKELEKQGYIFKNGSDTEVILASYDFWGVDCLNKFNGMWAFVIYDKKEQNFFISRDRFGKKPLYYSSSDELFIFCSEVKGIYASDMVEKKPNDSYLKKYLEDGANEYQAQTAFKNIYRFPFAHYFLGTEEELMNKPEFIRYWNFTVNTNREKFCPEKARYYAQQYYDLLSEAVKIRLRADVKIGSALSGGLDSSSIVYLINENLKRQGKSELQETFSSVYKSEGTEECDESKYIDLLAEKLNVNSNQIEPNEEYIPREHEKMIWHIENPPDSTLMSSWYTFLKVNMVGIKLTLDGQGADEQLGGYLMYIPSYLQSLSLSDFYKESIKFLKIPGAKKQVLLAYLLVHTRLILGERFLREIFLILKKRDIPLHLNLELKKSIENDLVTLIHYADHTSMAHGVESRMPFMDYRLIEFLATVPACYKMHNGWTKYIARLAFDKKLPDEVCWRKDKMGWPVPENYWFRGNLRDWFITSSTDSNLLHKVDNDFSFEKRLNDKFAITKLIRRLNVAVYEKLFFD